MMSEAAREAQRADRRAWYHKNKEHVSEYQKQWRKNNPDKVAQYQKNYWEKKAQEM